MSKDRKGPQAHGALGLCALAVGGAALVLGSGCGVSVPTHAIGSGLIQTPGVTIRAADGSFTLRSGEEFQPPFTNSCYPRAQAEWDALSPARLVEATDFAQRRGARRVDVMVPGRDRPLFGLLMLCDIPNSASGPASRSYRVTVPQEYVDAATGGRISAMYERVTYQPPAGLANWWYGWIIWLSDAPY